MKPEYELVLEVAILNIRSGQSESFEAAFAQAAPIIASVSGYQRHELRKCVEHSYRYILLVWWDSIESHNVKFRESAGYQEWKRLLHHFYDPFPVVEHYLLVP